MKSTFDRIIQDYEKWYILVPHYEGDPVTINGMTVYDYQDAVFDVDSLEFINDLDNAIVYVYRLDLFIRITKITKKISSKKMLFANCGTVAYRDMSFMTNMRDKECIDGMINLCKKIPHSGYYSFADIVREDIWKHARLSSQNYDKNREKAKYKNYNSNNFCIKTFEDYYLGGMFGGDTETCCVYKGCRCRDLKSAYGTIPITRNKIPVGREPLVSSYWEGFLDTEKLFGVMRISVKNLCCEQFELPDAYKGEELLVSNIDYKWITEFCKYDSLEIHKDKVYYWHLTDDPNNQKQWKNLLHKYWNNKNTTKGAERDFYKTAFNIACFGATVSRGSFIARQLPYNIGMYIVALQRYRWMNVVRQLGPYFVYGDTDSVYYYYNDGEFEHIFDEDYENFVQDKSYGKLGAWEIEHEDCDMKILATKVYLLYDNNKKEYSVKCAGCKPEYMMKYLYETGEDPFEAFHKDMIVPDTGIFVYDENCRVVIRPYCVEESNEALLDEILGIEDLAI